MKRGRSNNSNATLPMTRNPKKKKNKKQANKQKKQTKNGADKPGQEHNRVRLGRINGTCWGSSPSRTPFGKGTTEGWFQYRGRRLGENNKNLHKGRWKPKESQGTGNLVNLSTNWHGDQKTKETSQVGGGASQPEQVGGSFKPRRSDRVTTKLTKRGEKGNNGE